MTDPYQYIDATGVIVPDTSGILSDANSDFRGVFGQQLNVAPTTPQGMLIAARALGRSEVVKNNAAVANQINPDQSAGIFLDAIMALTGIGRKSATYTQTNNCTMAGTPGTVIQAGIVAKTPNGDLVTSASAVTLGTSSGNAVTSFIAQQPGPIPIPTGALTIVQGAPGLETIVCNSAGVLGQLTQGDGQAKAYRKNTLAFQGVGLIFAQISALYATLNVTSCWVQENYNNTTQTINGISMPANTLYAIVAGGTDLDVAAALRENKSNGAGWMGGTTVNLIEPASGQIYAVQFDRPTLVPILARVTIRKGNSTDVINSIMDYVNGLVAGQKGFVVAGNVSPFEMAGAINIEHPESYISKLEVTTAAANSFSTNEIVLAVNQQATITPSSIQVVQAT